ncbi:hypothetical protein DPEC_G00040890 [Dallia pectoralis]|uniref:Uncharacterized protein n=1 Tax=Dallia pectoralis TaxID=75939 RepID=A0ACC2HFG1_DALPE|nr:hypothetical protein DPEC_G00040890 [Dallia pectoralis]
MFFHEDGTEAIPGAAVIAATAQLKLKPMELPSVLKPVVWQKNLVFCQGGLQPRDALVTAFFLLSIHRRESPGRLLLTAQKIAVDRGLSRAEEANDLVYVDTTGSTLSANSKGSGSTGEKT